MKYNCINITILCLLFISCDNKETDPPVNAPTPIDSSHQTTPYVINYPKITRPGYYRIWPVVISPAGNPLTQEGVALGKKLFFDSTLSSTNTISCASCHLQSRAFADDKRFSEGVFGRLGTKNAMPLFNLGYAETFNQSVHRFFWDGRKSTLEDQVLGPITDENEMNQNLADLVIELNQNASYPPLFKKAFGSDSITISGVMKAIAQFERIMISGNAKFDKYLRYEAELTPQELNGYKIFIDEKGGDCFHCHAVSPFFTDFSFKNNGLNSSVNGTGLGAVTGNPLEMGLFKTPSLRNLSFTAPYMHDGRFNTLDEVIEFYNSGTQDSPTTDEVIRKHFKEGGLNLSTQDKADLIAFLKTLDDDEFLVDQNFK